VQSSAFAGGGGLAGTTDINVPGIVTLSPILLGYGSYNTTALTVPSIATVSITTRASQFVIALTLAKKGY
jgi:hypothetical protein